MPISTGRNPPNGQEKSADFHKCEVRDSPSFGWCRHSCLPKVNRKSSAPPRHCICTCRLDVEPEGAAAMASLRAGDLLLLSLDELYAALDSGGQALRLRFMRGAPSSGRLPLRETVVRLEERAAEAA